MLFARVNVNNVDVSKELEKLGVSKKCDFAFYDLIYLNKNGASITDDTLKIRVYQINEWNSKAVLVIRKKAEVVNGSKEDKVLLREEFDTEEEAVDFVNKNLGDEFEYKFKLVKDGIQYTNDTINVWVENIEGIGLSIEFGSDNAQEIEEAISLFDVRERLEISVPEYLYNKIRN